MLFAQRDNLRNHVFYSGRTGFNRSDNTEFCWDQRAVERLVGLKWTNRSGFIRTVWEAVDVKLEVFVVHPSHEKKPAAGEISFRK